ncbi:MAG: hypothetical protein V4488_20735 [Pseudomonadota bacterium]
MKNSNKGNIGKKNKKLPVLQCYVERRAGRLSRLLHCRHRVCGGKEGAGTFSPSVFVLVPGRAPFLFLQRILQDGALAGA